MTLSVIVPVYNVEKYLDECVKSILDQSFTDFELILVDDGSTDSSPAMCDAWATKDSRVRVIHKENGGPSRARQAGIKTARGRFLAFVDSDDKIEKDMYSVMLSAQAENDYDYVICGLKRFFTEKDDVRSEPAADFEAESRQEILDRLILPMIYRLDSEDFVSQLSTKIIYKKKIFDTNNIFYRSLDEYFSEDLLLNIEYLLCCKSAKSIPYTLYLHRANYESFTHTIKTNDAKLNSIFNMYYFVLSLFDNDTNVKNRISIQCLELLSVFLRHVVKNSSISAAYKRVNEICSKADTQVIVDFNYPGLSVKNRLMQKLIAGRHSLLLFAMIWTYNKIYIEK